MVRCRVPEKRSGLSVLEVLVAIVILAWVLAWNARMAETTITSDQYARWSRAAGEIAMTKAEQLRRAGYDQLAEKVYEDTESRDGTRFRCRASVHDVATPGVADLEIVVEWQKGTRIRGSQSFHTLLRKQ
jgi:Tfp pilus assembly protein PilV